MSVWCSAVPCAVYILCSLCPFAVHTCPSRVKFYILLLALYSPAHQAHPGVLCSCMHTHAIVLPSTSSFGPLPCPAPMTWKPAVTSTGWLFSARRGYGPGSASIQTMLRMCLRALATDGAVRHARQHHGRDTTSWHLAMLSASSLTRGYCAS